jgi:hypothetical protein
MQLTPSCKRCGSNRITNERGLARRLPIVCSIAFAAAGAGILPALSTHAQSNEELLAEFRQKDVAQLLLQGPQKPEGISGFRVSFLATRKVLSFDPEQGMQTDYVDTEWTKDRCVMKLVTTFEHPPVFRPPGTPGYKRGEWDKDGNLIVWREKCKYCLFATNVNDTLESSNMYRINPNGEIITSNESTKLLRFRIGDRNNIYIFDQFRQATGWGVGEQLVRIVEGPVAQPPNLRFFKAAANRPSGLKGTWDIRFEDGSDPIIRQGAFWTDGQADPTVQIESAGVMKCPGLKIAEVGTFTSGSYTRTFHVQTVTARGQV